jgi:hypothetical protein
MTAPPSAAEIDPRAAAVARLPSRIAFLGFGLIGGSIALALREAGYAGAISAWTPGRAGPEAGVRRGFVDEAGPSAAVTIEGAGLVVLAGPPLAVSAILSDPDPALRSAAAAGGTVTDVASTKGVIVGTAESAGLPFVGGHPMAGRETTGVESALANLFVDRPWVIVPARTARDVDVDAVAALAGAAGARPIRMTADEHGHHPGDRETRGRLRGPTRGRRGRRQDGVVERARIRAPRGHSCLTIASDPGRRPSPTAVQYSTWRW